MKKEFFGFYEPSSNEIENSWHNGLFIFDANALLNLYRYSESTRNDFILALTKLKDKLFMPFQVGHEYQTNRLSVIDGLRKSHSNLRKTFREQFDKTFETHVNQYSRHPSIEIEKLKAVKEQFLSDFETAVDEQEGNHPDFSSNDSILTSLTEIFDGKVGKGFSRKELKQIYVDGKERYEQQIPLGLETKLIKRKKVSNTFMET